MDPFPSSPSRPSRYAITAIKTYPGESFARTYATSFRELYGAAVWLRLLIGNEECVQRGNELTTASGIKLRSVELNDILGYELVGKERDYRLPEEYVMTIARFRRGTWEARPVLPLDVVTTVATTSSAEAKRPVERIIAPEHAITVATLVRGSPLSAMNARALLRASGYVKPAYGWAFLPTQLPEIKKVLGL